MAAMMNDDDGPPEDVVDGVQSTMTGLVDKAGGAVAAMAASVGDAVKASLGGVLKSSAPPAAKKAKKKKTAKTKAASKAKKARKAAKAAKAVAAPVTPPKAPRAAPTQEEPVVAAAPPAPEAAPPQAGRLRRPSRSRARRRGGRDVVQPPSIPARGRELQLEWQDPNVFNTVAADVRAAADEPAPPPPEAEEEAAAAPGEEAPEAAAATAAEQPADDESCEEAADVQGLLDGAAQRVIVDMLLANASLKIAFDQENPKRPDSASFKRYEAYKAATCGADVLAWGGSKSDVLHDYRKGFLRVTRCPVMVAYDLDRDADVGLS